VVFVGKKDDLERESWAIGLPVIVEKMDLIGPVHRIITMFVLALGGTHDQDLIPVSILRVIGFGH
jgi:hypothetical protein